MVFESTTKRSESRTHNCKDKFGSTNSQKVEATQGLSAGELTNKMWSIYMEISENYSAFKKGDFDSCHNINDSE